MATADAAGGAAAVQQSSYIKGVNSDPTAPPTSEFAAAQLRLSVAGSNAMRCGHRTIDVELVIVARSLQRLHKHLSADAQATFELRVVQSSLARIAKVLRSLHVKAADSAGDDTFEASMAAAAAAVADSGDDDGSTTTDAGEEEDEDDDGGSGEDPGVGSGTGGNRVVTPSGPSGPSAAAAAAAGRPAAAGAADRSAADGSASAGSPARMLRQQLGVPRRILGGSKATKRRGGSGHGGGRGSRPSIAFDPEMRAVRRRGRGSLWPVLLQVAARARGEYAFHLEPSEVRANAAALVTDAPAYGLANIANRLILTREPQLKLSNHPGPAPGPIQPIMALTASATTVGQRVRSAFLASAPPGIVDFMASRGLQLRPSASSKWGSHDPKNILVKGATPFMTTGDNEGATIAVDFFAALVMPTGYAFSSVHHIIPGCFPRTWRLEGSMDAIEWTLLSDHTDDESFDADRQTVAFSIDPPSRPAAASSPSRAAGKPGSAPDDRLCEGVYRHFRLVNAGPNSSGSQELQVHGLELYGNLLFVQPDETTRHGLAGPITRQATVVSPPTFKPVDMAAMTSTKGKKKKG